MAEQTYRVIEWANGHVGKVATATAGVNVILAVCDTAPGIVTHFELNMPQLRGPFRPESSGAR